MSSLLSRLSSTAKSKPIKPREIFMTLPSKDRRYEYPRDVQSEVWEKWFDRREFKNNIIKMNTGSGKTVVGLMMLQSCLNEGVSPAIYVVPNKYLVQQVCTEAKRLGVRIAADTVDDSKRTIKGEDDYYYINGQAILVITMHKLVNGRSVFGMRQSGNYPIGSILIDDVHACLDTISDQFSLQIKPEHELYSAITSLFAKQLKEYDYYKYYDVIDSQDPRSEILIPFWIWQSKQAEVYKLLKQYNNHENEDVFFHLPLIQDCLSTCSCVITARSIEITPKGIPISKIESFVQAKRRIFMSATLADDSVFISAVGLKHQEITDIITPDNANDLGDRLILFPAHLNSRIKDEEIKEKVLSFSKTFNVVVIVPSFERARFWDKQGKRTTDSYKIDRLVEALKTRYFGLVVLVNRYDGIDLPDDACRMLVIDGLPPFRSEYDRYVQGINPMGKSLCREQIQKIEQGMGRGVRSNNDSCCVVLMGSKLADVLVHRDGIDFFSNATAAQYKLSKELWDELKRDKPNPSIDDIFELADYSLNRETEWIELSKQRLSNITYSSVPIVDNITIALREAFEKAMLEHYSDSAKILEKVANVEDDEKTKGYLKQLIAEYVNFNDETSAQQILLSARELNAGVLIPVNGVRKYDRLATKGEQVKAIIEEIYDYMPNDYTLRLNAIMDDLSFSPDAYGFEEALKSTGSLLGFASSRPEYEYGKGPDNLWSIDSGHYLVIECKSGTTTDTINKHDCNQLNGSEQWFATMYEGTGFSCLPIMIHNSKTFEYACSPSQDIKIMTPQLLEKFKNNIRKFARAISQPGIWKNEYEIQTRLADFKLRGKDIVKEYTTRFYVKQR